MTSRDGDAPPYYFYELHESDTDLFADVLLAHQTEFDEAEFLEMVLETRKRIIDDYGEESLIEAVAAELGRAGRLPRHRRLTAARRGQRLGRRGRHVRGRCR